MRTVGLEEIRRAVVLSETVGVMRDAVVAQSRGECDTPMPMHLSVGGPDSEVHIKSSARRGGEFFALKAAGTFPRRPPESGPPSNGMMLLCSAVSGDPVAFFLDGGWLTDVRTAAVAAMAARELKRQDTVLGILGTGVQARLQALLHAQVLPLKKVVLWGRSAAHAGACRQDLAKLLPTVEVAVRARPQEVAAETRLIVAATAARAPLLTAADIRPGTLVSAVGSDSPGKQELDPEILRKATLLLVDSLAQCERLGELQHAPTEKGMAVELGAFCQSPMPVDPQDIIVCDFTGLGVEDLAIAEYVYRRLAPTG